MPLLLNGIFLLLIDAYIFSALRASSLRWAKSSLFSILWWGYSIVLLIGLFASIRLNIPLAFRSVVLVAFFLTFVSKAVYALVLLVDDIRRWIIWARRKFEAKPNPERGYTGDKISRSEFMTRAGIVVAAAPLATLGYGVAVGGYDFQVRRQPLYLPNLPKAFHGLVIAQISDIHSGSFFNKKAVISGIELLLAQKPDVIFFTGDLVNSLASEMSGYKDLFSKVRAPLGTYSVLGNHDYGDYYFGRGDSLAKSKNLADIKSIHHMLGWDLLLNSNKKLVVDNEAIGILGSENWGGGRFPKYGDLAQVLKGTEEMPVKLLLSHDPSHWRGQVLDHPSIDVMFAGHTHGMQFGVRGEHYQWSPIQYVYKEWAGHYTHQHQQLYVNVGFGFLGYPGRVGITPEITLFELRSSPA